MHEPTDSTTGAELTGENLRRISSAIVGLYREHFGKGPTGAKTYVLDDLVICVLRDGLTTVEKTLFERGKGDVVREMRAAFQDAVADRFTSTVERLTNRKVVAFMSQAHVAPDLAIEVFCLDQPVGPVGTIETAVEDAVLETQVAVEVEGRVPEVEHRFNEAAVAVLEHEPSGGRFVLEEIVHLLAVEVGAAEVVVCLNGLEDGTTRAVAVWGSDWYECRRLEWAAMNGTLAACMARHRVPAALVESTPVWEFDARRLGTRTGWALPLEAGDHPGIVCLLFDARKPDPTELVDAVREFDDVLARVPGIAPIH